MKGLWLVCCLVLAQTALSSHSVHHTLLLSGRRDLGALDVSLPSSASVAELALLVAAEFGHLDSIEREAVESSDGLMDLSSGILEKPQVVIVAFLPSHGNELPSHIFDSSLSPFVISGDHDCNNNDLDCIRESLMKLSIDDQSSVVVMDSNVEFLQWVGNHSNVSEIGDNMFESIQSSLKSEKSQLSSTVKELQEVLPSVSLNGDEDSFKMGSDDSSVTFDFDNTCTRILLGELSALLTLKSHMAELSAKSSSSNIFILSPLRGFACFKETSASAAAIANVESLLVNVVNAIIKSVDRETEGSSFSLIGFYDHTPALQTSPEIQPSSGFHAVAEPSVVSFIQRPANVVDQRRLQAITPTKFFPMPRLNLLVLCIVLVFAVVFAVIPLLYQTPINDPIISTKLFSGVAR